MGDADSDIRNCEERDRLRAIVPEKHADRLKELFPLIEEYQKKRADLIELGYKIETSLGSLKIWKEI